MGSSLKRKKTRRQSKTLRSSFRREETLQRKKEKKFRSCGKT